MSDCSPKLLQSISEPTFKESSFRLYDSAKQDQIELCKNLRQGRAKKERTRDPIFDPKSKQNLLNSEILLYFRSFIEDLHSDFQAFFFRNTARVKSNSKSFSQQCGKKVLARFCLLRSFVDDVVQNLQHAYYNLFNYRDKFYIWHFNMSDEEF